MSPPCRTPAGALTIAATLALAVAASYGLWVRTPVGRSWDANPLQGRVPLRAGDVGWLAHADALAITLIAAAALGAVWAGWRRGHRAATWGVVVAAVVAAQVAAQLGKAVLPHPGLPFAPAAATFPSGHTTALASLSLAALLLAPPAARSAVVMVSVLGCATMGALLIAAGRHRTSDVVAGVLLAGAAIAVISPWVRTPSSARNRVAVGGVLLTALGVLAIGFAATGAVRDVGQALGEPMGATSVVVRAAVWAAATAAVVACVLTPGRWRWAGAHAADRAAAPSAPPPDGRGSR